MREIIKDNYKMLEYNWGGIIVAYPKINLFFNADFYFIKQQINYETNERTYYYSGVNQEDEVSEIAPDWKKQDFESCFKDWENLKYYQFENMEDFCNWYIHKDDKLKESIKQFLKDTDDFYAETEEWTTEKCGTNTPPKVIPKTPSVGNKKKENNSTHNTNKEKYKDIIQYIETRLSMFSTVEVAKTEKDYYKKQLYLHMIEQRQAEIDKWLNEEVQC